MTVARVFITGSAAGLGRLAAESLLDGGHDVIVHGRRVDTLRDLVARGASTVVGDLADLGLTRDVAGMDWTEGHETGSYSDSKLFVTALALAIARRWPDVLCNAVDRDGCPPEWAAPAHPTT